MERVRRLVLAYKIFSSLGLAVCLYPCLSDDSSVCVFVDGWMSGEDCPLADCPLTECRP